MDSVPPLRLWADALRRALRLAGTPSCLPPPQAAATCGVCASGSGANSATCCVRVRSTPPQQLTPHAPPVPQVFELRPDVPWDKGRAVEYLLSRLHAPPPVAQSGTTHGAAAQGSSSAIPAAERGQSRLCPFYLGDDVADEDALGFVESVGGIGIKARRGGALED